ncbi:type I methionyl aminopeptidase [Gracilinema caldarium]|uniref:Methionine aminopeptidase n=1 Tax=Gracilinema caldarium (strain ATCC 51460 / DSM 7334 / H1) TaxID=744872 RepID=F8F3K4_GRAC1|nr:type I methionyl aminopeptidase [Gracilinema caldarium]AEJ19948.1 methionine aminopeptidase, type I [Gracilinema caldarium DSM 7334]
MIRLKNKEQIAGIRESCKMLSSMFKELTPLVVPGVETRDLDQWVQHWIKKAGGKPAFLQYGDDDNPFPAALCVSINEEVIHGIPSKRKIVPGDLVSLDCGINLGGYFSDMAMTIEVGEVSDEAKQLNRVTKECLDKAIEQARFGNRILQIARAVYNHATGYGYGVVHQYCGHGVGFSPHEDPQVPNNPRGPNPRMIEGLVIAIEPMINLGTAEVDVLDDGWTVVTADRKISCHWEHTVAIFEDHTEVLTL